MISRQFLPKSVLMTHKKGEVIKWVFFGLFVWCVLLVSHWRVNHENMTSARSQEILAAILVSGMFATAAARSWWRWEHFCDQVEEIQQSNHLFQEVFDIWPSKSYPCEIYRVQNKVTLSFMLMRANIEDASRRLERLKARHESHKSSNAREDMQRCKAELSAYRAKAKTAIQVASDWGFDIPKEIYSLAE